MAKKKVISLWKALMLVFTGFIVIAGGTALVLYLMGEFERDVVEPDHMDFSQEVQGEAYYDGETTISGVNGKVGVFKTSGNFQMTIISNTEGVTETEVSLTLKNQISSRNGVLSDGVVMVPEKVYLNTPFTVSLVQGANVELSGTGVESWVLGGNSVITAKSTNILLDPIYMQVQVDVPVYKIEVAVAGKDFGEEIQTVYLDLPFVIDTKFTPTESEYLFSNELTAKKVFFSETKGYIHYDWKSEKFMADKKSGADYDTIKYYVFANSYYEKTVLEKFDRNLSKEELNSAILNYANEKDKSGKLIHEHEFKTAEIKIKVTDVAVESISLGSNQKEFMPYLNKSFTLTTNSTVNGDGTLDAIIRDSDQVIVNSALANLGIRFATTFPEGKSQFISNFSMTGGDVVRVVKMPNGLSITKESFDAQNISKYYEENITINGETYYVAYYLLPSTRPSSYLNYYWQFACKQAYDVPVELDINFFFENEQGQLENFFFIEGFDVDGTDKDDEGIIKIKPVEHDYEEDPSWTNTTIIMNINFDSAGNAISVSQDLSKDLSPINQSNVYKTVKYFLFIDDQLPDGDKATIDPLDYFDLKEEQTYSKDYLGADLAIPGTKERTGGYTLYEFANGSVLTANKSFAGMVSIIAATIKTDANGNAIMDGDKYIIVKTSYVRNVKVESSLSIQNLVGEFAIDGTFLIPEKDDNYFIPSVNRDVDGSQKTVISFTLTLNNSEDGELDRQKIESAFSTGSLKVVCLDAGGGELLNQYLSLESPAFREFNAVDKKVVFQGNFIIEEAFFTKTILDSLDQGTYIALQLQYDDGRMLHTKKIENVQADKKDYFYIYAQQPKELVWDLGDAEKEAFYEVAGGEKELKYINVEITSSGTKITWQDPATEIDLDALNEILKFKIVDQMGKDIDANAGTYRVQFIETPVAGEVQKYLAFNGVATQINGFNSTAGQSKETTMRAYVVDAEGQFAFTYDANGNVQMGEDGLDDDENFYNKSEQYKFAITSEGVAVVLYDKETDIIDPPAFEHYAESSNNGSVRVAKYILPQSKIDMSGLLKVYLDRTVYETDVAGSTLDGALTNLKFYLDPTFVTGLSDDRAEDLMQMMTIDAKDESGTDFSSTILFDYIGKEIIKIDFTASFKVDTELKFLVRDENDGLFEIELALACKADLRIGNAFNTYYDKYSEYLVQKDNSIGVFADESYSLTEYLTLTSTSTTDPTNYTWEKAFDGYASYEDFIVVNNIVGGDSICSLEKSGTNVLLKIEPVYTITTINVKIYYRIVSEYACSISFTLCLNPNIVIEEKVDSLDKNPYINLAGALSDEMKLSNKYNVYKFTGVDGYYNYLVNGTTPAIYAGFAADEKFLYENNSTSATADMQSVCKDEYIMIDDSGSIIFVENDDGSEKTISLELGGKISQRFAARYVVGSGASQKTTNLQAIKIRYVSADEYEIVLTPEDTAYLTYDIIYGTGNFTSSVIGRTDYEGLFVADVTTVRYNSQDYALLLLDSYYVAKNGFSFSNNTEGELQYSSSTKIRTRGEMGSLMSFVGNNFKVFKTILGTGADVVKIEIAMKAIVSGIGENFVYYETESGFNKFGDVEFQDLLGNWLNGDRAYKSLEENNIYQECEAGLEYEIISSYPTVDSPTIPSKPGFYYSDTFINTVMPTHEVLVSIVSEAEGYIDGLARITTDNKLHINHLSEAYKEAYIVLRIEVAELEDSSRNFVWYYRIKVTPTFDIDSVTYPYAEDAEYLDSTSKEYYKYDATEKKYGYEINLEENLTEKNSKHSLAQRFADIITPPAGLTKVYSIAQVLVDGVEIDPAQYNNYFTYEKATGSENLNGSSLKLKLNNEKTKLTIVVERRLYSDPACEDFMIGSEQRYTFKFNQGDVYELAISQKQGIDLAQLIDENNNIFKSTVIAGKGEVQYTITINKTEGGVAMPVSMLSATFVEDDAELEKSLFAKQVARKGTKYYTSAAFTTEAGTLGQDIILGDWKNTITDSKVTGIYNPTVAEEYYIKAADTEWAFAYMSGKNLVLMPKDSIAEDMSFELVFFTEQKPAFYIDLAVEGGFTINQELTEVVGGKEYTIANATGAIFSEVSGVGVTRFSIELEEEAKTAKVKEFEGLDGVNPILTYADLIKINIAGTEIQFAQLKTDVTFNFIGKISTDAGEYTFKFSIVAKKSFEDKTRTYKNAVYQISGKLFDIAIGNPEFNGELNSSFGTTYELDKASLTPKNVTSSETITEVMAVVCKFYGTEIFSFDINYVYTALKNVEVEAYYPKPDGVNESEMEYVEAKHVAGSTKWRTEIISNFFTTSALYNEKGRISVEDLSGGAVKARDWNIAISSISNVVVYKNGTTELKNVGDVVYKGISPVGVNLTFELQSDAVVGEVVFAVMVNNVPETYKVAIVPGAVYEVVTYAPNYANNKEIIYAEDYATQEQDIFAEGRILHYAFLATTPVDSEYYVRLKSGSEIQAVKITASVVGMDINQDLEKSYKGYTYEGTFSDENSAKNNVYQYRLDDTELFKTVPVLTNRIEVYYYDGTKVKFEAGQFELKLNGVGLSSITLSKDDTAGKDIRVKLYIKSTELNTATNYKYTVQLDTKFEMEGGVASDTDYTVIELQANPKNPINLLSLSSLNANAIRLINPTTGELYTEESLYASQGTISLQIYGFEGLEIKDAGDDLQKVAFAIHNKLLSTTEANGVKYSTGLIPRADENAGNEVKENGWVSSGYVENNYISITGLKYKETGKIVNYNIFAQGANNDGNHVMMRLTYSIRVGTESIDKHFNILFKVLPNSSVSFRTKLSETGTTATSVEYVDGQSIASNFETPLEIEQSGSSATTFYVYNANPPADTVQKHSIMKALMYGSSQDSTKDFASTCSQVSGVAGYLTDETITNSADATIITVGSVALGEKNYIVECTNSFGYKARLYFRVFSNTNPQIISGDLTLTEGENFAFGAQYQTVTQENSMTFTNEYETGSAKVAEAIKFLATSGVDGVDATAKITVHLAGTKELEATGGDDTKLSAILLTAECEITSTSVHNFTIPKYESSDLDKDYKDDPVHQKWRNEGGNFVFPLATDFAGATYTITFTFNDEKKIPSSLRVFVLYQGGSGGDETKNLTQSYSITPTPENATLGSSNKFIIGGLRAYAFDKSAPISKDLSGLADGSLVSNVTESTITEVRFFAEGDSTGKLADEPSAGYGLIASNTTDDSYRYVKSYDSTTGNMEIASGNAYIPADPAGAGGNAEEFNFIVPHFNGIDFGTGDIISNVRMVVTLKVGANSCQISRIISIKRETSSEQVFENNTIADGASPKVKTTGLDDYNRSATVTNDTLEIRLDPGADISLAITKSELAIASIKDKDNDEQDAYKMHEQNIIHLTNDTPYAVTKYVSITQNIKDLDVLPTKFFVYVADFAEKNFVVNYNGDELISFAPSNETYATADGNLAVKGYKTAETSLATINSVALKLHINHTNELNGSNEKEEELYFLIKHKDEDINEYYQHTETFTVNPEFTEAQHESSIENYFAIDDYYKVSKLTESYYIATADKWAKGIDLTNIDANDTANTDFDIKSVYKYYFEVDTTLGGSAVIDENGMITTSTDFDIASHTVFVNMYMKVSGAYGDYAASNDKIKIGQFRLYFNAGKELRSTSLSAGVYYHAPNVIVVPTGYTFYKTDGATDISGSAMSFTSLEESHAVEVGTTLTKEMLNEWYKHNLPAGTVIVDYHIVSFGAEELYYNNVNNYTFTKADTGELKVVAVCRSASGTASAIAFHKTTVIVYDSAIVENKFVAVQKGVPETSLFTAGGDWYHISATGVAGATSYLSGELGVHDEKYIVKSGSTTKIVNVKYFVYAGVKDVNVALRPLTNYQLSGLAQSQLTGTAYFENLRTYKKNADGTITERSTDSFNNVEHDSANATYIIMGDYYADAAATTSETYVYLYNVTYHMIPLSVTEIGMVVKKGSNVKASVETEIKNKLKVSSLEMFVETDDYGVEHSVSAVEISNNVETRTYLVKANGKYHRVQITFYAYNEASTINTSIAIPTLAYNLSDLNDAVKAEFSYTWDPSAEIVYAKLNEDTGELETVSQISLEVDKTETFMVKMGLADGTSIYLKVTFVFDVV